MNRQNKYGINEEVAAAAEAARALAYIEAHLFEDLSLARIASHCAASPFHFARRFARRQGASVMSYVRGRRLDSAARQLRDGLDVAVADVAAACCFESHAGFARAFHRAFGMSPSRYRREATPPTRTVRKVSMQPVLEESVEHVDTIRVAGLSGRYDPTSYVRVPELWKGFAEHKDFAGRLGSGETCGVFRDRDFSLQSFEHLAGARVAAGFKPAGLEVWTLPPCDYLVCKQWLQEGELHPQVAAAQTEIWSQRLPRCGRKLAHAADFQIYPADFKVGPGGWIAYYLPLEMQ